MGETEKPGDSISFSDQQIIQRRNAFRNNVLPIAQVILQDNGYDPVLRSLEPAVRTAFVDSVVDFSGVRMFGRTSGENPRALTDPQGDAVFVDPVTQGLRDRLSHAGLDVVVMGRTILDLIPTASQKLLEELYHAQNH